jgi:hypothetical protein
MGVDSVRLSLVTDSRATTQARVRVDSLRNKMPFSLASILAVTILITLAVQIVAFSLSWRGRPL